jgi:hypothetical protein
VKASEESIVTEYFNTISPFEYKGRMLSAKRLASGPALSNDLNVPAVPRPDRWHGYIYGQPLHQWDAKDGENEDDVRARLRTEAEAELQIRPRT